MYCDKQHVNQLTSLLLEYNIRHVVVCPGSRNGILVHNFHVDPAFQCYPVTDERSAAFFAIGLSQAIERPVAVCVTSGSALLNTLPAVAEAYYQHIPLIILSADRPMCWIDQQDGQTLHQPHALHPYTRKAIQLTEPTQEEDHWWNNRLINEALLTLTDRDKGPVHINIPISEPLFTFHTNCLPKERVIKKYTALYTPLPDEITQIIRQAQFPVLVLGQMLPFDTRALQLLDDTHQLFVIPELISNTPFSDRIAQIEQLLKNDPDTFTPDVVVYAGGNLVHKQLKNNLRKQNVKHLIRISEESGICDTFCQTTAIIEITLVDFLTQLVPQLCNENGKETLLRFKQQLQKAVKPLDIPIEFCDAGVMQQIGLSITPKHVLHLANSSVVRNAVHLRQPIPCPVYCNRGVNGIEGSLSTAVGYAVGNASCMVLCLIGDLSFFYDQNALWNSNLRNNLRILLFNNGGGRIFHHLPGLHESPARDNYIAAAHQTTAKGIAEAHHLTYLTADNYTTLHEALSVWFSPTAEHPILLEVFTSK